ncbi:MAG: HAD-IA family hydrolase [Patescibacteria group bacterium]|jgi:predicted adenylyl cyclase CyaB
MESNCENFYLDKVFKEKTDYIGFAFDIYKKIYNLSVIKYHGNVSEELFEYCLKRKYFILLTVYDEDGDVYLERNIQEQLFWSLPGGSIQKNEDIHTAVKRILKEISEDNNIDMMLGEIEPIAFVHNEFIFNGNTCCHFGLAFSARIRNKKDFNFYEAKGRFVKINQEELKNINRYANREVVRICSEYIKKFKSRPLEKEISTNEKVKWRYFIHDVLVKRFILTPTLKRKRKFLEVINNEIGDCKSLIDVSCGDSRLISEIYNRKNLNYAVANDVSWSQINTRQREGKRILFTNHNASYLSFSDTSFDVAVCSNTLHHISSREELFGLFANCFRVADKIVIIEIEDPRKTGLFPMLLNKYWYSGFLKDVGGSYFNKENFQSVIKEFFKDNAEVDFKEFKNIQGKYLIATINKKHKKGVLKNYIEVEDKFFLKDKNSLIEFCEKNGFSRSDLNVEKDEYFSDVKGEFIKNRTCLRLRSSGKYSELTFKGKSSSLSGFYSKVEHNAPMSPESANSIKFFLPSLGYFKYNTVEKERIVFSRNLGSYFENICIDNLRGIGLFVEFEILANSPEWILKKDELTKILFKLISNTGINNLERADKPYRDYVADYLSENVLNKKNAKVFLFDFDGTIAKTEHIFFSSFSKVVKELSGKEISLVDYVENELKEYDKLFDIAELSSFSNKEDFMNLVYDDYRETLKKYSFSDLLAVNMFAIKKIREMGYKIGLVSSSKKEFIDIILKEYNVEDIFDVCIFREDTEFTKPFPHPYSKAVDKLAIDPKFCVAVEDSPRGIKSALDAGLKCVFCRGEILNEPAGKEVYYFDSLMEIALILENTN